MISHAQWGRGKGEKITLKWCHLYEILQLQMFLFRNRPRSNLFYHWVTFDLENFEKLITSLVCGPPCCQIWVDPESGCASSYFRSTDSKPLTPTNQWNSNYVSNSVSEALCVLESKWVTGKKQGQHVNSQSWDVLRTTAGLRTLLISHENPELWLNKT